MGRERVSTLVDCQFEEVHIKLVWTELQKRFGFNAAEWKKKYWAEWNRNRAHDEAGLFLVYMNQHVNPLLNKILCRPDLYPTLNKLVDYVVTGRSKADSHVPHPCWYGFPGNDNVRTLVRCATSLSLLQETCTQGTSRQHA